MRWWRLVPHWCFSTVWKRESIQYHVFTVKITSSFIPVKIGPWLQLYCWRLHIVLCTVVGILPVADKAEGNYGCMSYMRRHKFTEIATVSFRLCHLTHIDTQGPEMALKERLKTLQTTPRNTPYILDTVVYTVHRLISWPSTGEYYWLHHDGSLYIFYSCYGRKWLNAEKFFHLSSNTGSFVSPQFTVSRSLYNNWMKRRSCDVPLLHSPLYNSAENPKMIKWRIHSWYYFCFI